MRLSLNISFLALLIFGLAFYGCKSKTNKLNENNVTHSIDETKEIVTPGSEGDPEPVSCIDWIGYYGKMTRQLDSTVTKINVKIKSEGFDKYNSPDRLEGAYVLKDANTPIKVIQDLAQYLAYKLCLSDNKNFKGILMDCQRRKIQVVIARSEKNYKNEAWAVVCNIFPANKKGQIIVEDYIK